LGQVPCRSCPEGHARTDTFDTRAEYSC
jgi:hypothetical protein